WEDDRNPAAFFEAMTRLDAMAREGRAPDFAIAVAGQTYRTRPPAFDRSRDGLAGRIETWGHVEPRREYLELLRRGTVAVSTSNHEFFGVSVMEAVYMGCAPLLPRRLTYPEIACRDDRYLYDADREIPEKLATLLTQPDPASLVPLRERIRTFDAGKVIARWDAIVDDLTSR
ncbi:MAG TPA: glycosyltransferase, partial [Candidatus Saccharimonadales bacterium]|nr:glycosyltransferase [Candidatus Saccharimonadales bacterium]